MTGGRHHLTFSLRHSLRGITGGHARNFLSLADMVTQLRRLEGKHLAPALTSTALLGVMLLVHWLTAAILSVLYGSTRDASSVK